MAVYITLNTSKSLRVNLLRTSNSSFMRFSFISAAKMNILAAEMCILAAEIHISTAKMKLDSFLLQVFLFSISLFRSLFLLVIIGAQLFYHFFGFTRCCGMANDYLSRLINNDKAGDTQYLPFVSQFGV